MGKRKRRKFHNKVDYSQRPEYLEWISKILGKEYSKELSTTLAILRDDQLIACVVYHDFADGNIEAGVVATAKGWTDGGVTAHLFGYPFIQMGCRRITMRVRADNPPAIKVSQDFGFVKEGVVREAINGVDVIIYGMLKSECTYIRGKNG